MTLPLPIQTLPPISTPYLDSSVFIAHIREETQPAMETKTRFQITSALLGAAEQGKYKIYTSTLTIAEVRRLKDAKKELTANELPKINALFKRFMEHEWIVPIEVSRAVAEKGQMLGATFGMSPTDAVHLASAILVGCNVLMVLDKKTFVNKVGAGSVEGVYVREPYYEGIIPWSALSAASSP